MSKVIISPIERYKGSVTIADPLTIPQAQAVERGMVSPTIDADGKVWLSFYDGNQIYGVIACVEKWSLENLPDNLTVDSFPASPRKETHQLIDWIYSEIQKVYFGELLIPNVSSPTPISIPVEDGTAKDTDQ
jgi:hypothetical protein